MKSFGKRQKLQKRGKLLLYAKEPEHVQRALDETRLAEWKKWQKHSAADVISVQEAARLVSEGAEEIGTQWVEVDRNEKIRIESEQAGEAKHVPMNLKSRLVALGNQEKRELRSDSPTADAEGIRLVFSFASSRKAKVMCGDLETAYFTGERTSRVLLLRQPRSRLPGLNPDDRLLARVPVTELRMQDADSGKSFVARWSLEVYTLTVDGQLRGIVATHVDDLLYAFDGPTAFDLVERVRVQLLVLWARSIRLFVRVICEATTLKINEIRFEGNHVHVRKTAQERLTASEQEQYESVTGSLQWVVRVARVESQAAESRLQQMKKHATVAAAVFANKVLQYLKKTATRGLMFRMGVISWHLGDFVIGSISDA